MNRHISKKEMAERLKEIAKENLEKLRKDIQVRHKLYYVFINREKLIDHSTSLKDKLKKKWVVLDDSGYLKYMNADTQGRLEGQILLIQKILDGDFSDVETI